MANRLALLDIPPGTRGDLIAACEEAGLEVSAHTGIDDFLAGAVEEPADLAAVDIDTRVDGVDGLEVIRRLHARDPDLPVVAVARSADVDRVLAATQAGAVDFLVYSGHLRQRIDTLLGKTRRLMQLVRRNRQLRSQLGGEDGTADLLLGESAQIRELKERIERLARIPRPLLIIGERGTGKELVAEAIHRRSGREGPLVPVNCAAFSDNLLESELFGHERGAYTGADRTVPGRFEQADGGTLFLDEIGNMPLPFQQKILRAVEYGRFSRVGSSEEIATTARIIAATNRDLREQIRRGEFLADLYDRLSFEVLTIAPLRERPRDIVVLAQHFMRRFMHEIPALQGKVLADSALEALRRHPFEGNVRELKNIIERAAYRDVTNEITPVDLGLELTAETDPHPETGDFKQRVEAYRRRLITEALERCDGNQAAAARELGLSYHQYRYFLQKYR